MLGDVVLGCIGHIVQRGVQEFLQSSDPKGAAREDLPCRKAGV